MTLDHFDVFPSHQAMGERPIEIPLQRPSFPLERLLLSQKAAGTTDDG